MIITKTPVRISLFGGGSDYPEFINKYGFGMCINAAIELYSYISVKKLPDYFDYKTRITYSEIETVNNNQDIKHNGFREAINRIGLSKESLEINYVSDCPKNAGLGSSSSMLVGLVYALTQYSGYKYLPEYDIFQISNKIESKLMKSTVGKQDHAAATYGSINCYTFPVHGASLLINHSPFIELVKVLETYGSLIYTKQSRDASNIAKQYVGTKDYFDKTRQILQIAENFMSLNEYDPKVLGNMLEMSWLIKRSIEGVSNYLIDDIYEGCIDNGAYGGRLMGAGGGGCLFLLAEPEKHKNIIEWCERFGCVQIPFRISLHGTERVL